jgi:hypothetical protein
MQAVRSPFPEMCNGRAQEVGVGDERGKYIISDEFSRQLRDVCTALQSAKNQTLVEFDIKQLLGFK